MQNDRVLAPRPALVGQPPAVDPVRRRRVRAARAIAIGADLLQFVLLPLVWGGALSPVQDVIDVAVAILMIALVGWHWAFLPTFVAELIPGIDLVPSWTLAVFLATRAPRPPRAGRS